MGEEYSFESDVWSMGVIILEALHGRRACWSGLGLGLGLGLG